MLLEINEKWLIYLNSFADTELNQKIFGFLADIPIFFLPIFLFGMWMYYVTKNNNSQKKSLLIIFYSTLGAIIFNYIIKQFFHFDRPETVLEGVGNLVLNNIPDASFPSDHAAVSMAFVTSLYFVGFKKTAYIFFPIAIIMNTSRIISGVHWPFDIIVGTIIGILSGYIFGKLIKDNKYIQNLNNFFIKIASYIRL